jgi:hypothetical protein
MSFTNAVLTAPSMRFNLSQLSRVPHKMREAAGRHAYPYQ